MAPKLSKRLAPAAVADGPAAKTARFQIMVKTEPLEESRKGESAAPEVAKPAKGRAKATAKGGTEATAKAAKSAKHCEAAKSSAQSILKKRDATKAANDAQGAREVTSAPTSSRTAEERVAIAANAGIRLPPALESGGDIDIKQILKNAAADTGKTEKALREAFKRTLPDYQDSRSAAKEGRPKKIGKLPDDIVDKMVGKADYDFWLGVWLESGSEYVDSESFQVDQTDEIDGSGQTRAWLNDEQMLFVYKSRAMVAAYQKELMKNPKHNRDHPEIPWCKEAFQFSCVVDDSTRSSIRTVLSKGTKATAQIENAAAAKLIRRGKMRGPPSVCDQQQRELAASSAGTAGGAGAKDAKTDAQTHEEKDAAAKKAAELAKQRAAALKDPRVQRSKWLTGVAALISKVQEKAASAAEATSMPNNMGAMYKDVFDNGVDSLMEFRTWLERPGRSPKPLKAKMSQANKKATELKKEIEAFDGLLRTYNKYNK